MSTQRVNLGSKMRAGLLACCVLAAGAAPMLAQDAPPPPQQGQGRGNPAEMEQRRLDMMTKQLNLSPDQVTQVKGIMEAQRQQMMAQRQDGSAPADRRAQMMAMRQATNAKIRAVLTDDQKTKYDAMEAQMQERQQQRGGNGGPPPPPASQL